MRYMGVLVIIYPKPYSIYLRGTITVGRAQAPKDTKYRLPFTRGVPGEKGLPMADIPWVWSLFGGFYRVEYLGLRFRVGFRV